MSHDLPSSPALTDALASRRNFVKTAAGAATGLALSSRFAFAAPTSDKKIRIGVVGGNFGCAFYWHEHPNCIVEAVSDLRPDRRQRLSNVYKCKKTYESLEKLVLDKNIDAVAIFTPVPDHVRHVTAAMNAGKHVICAVPAAHATLEECQQLIDVVKKTGLTYMMAETSYYRQETISARKFFKDGRFGDIFYTESEYHHPGLETLFFEDGKRGGKHTWRYGMTPIWYITHCTSFLTGVTGERMVEVTCLGWGDGDQILKDNPYKNPFWNETAMFKTNKGNPFRVAVYWKGALHGMERAQWHGSKMSFYCPHDNGTSQLIVNAEGLMGKDSAGFPVKLPRMEQYKQPEYWLTDMVPKTMRHGGGHGGAETFLTHEFIDSLVHNRKPAIDVYEAVAYTAPGIVAHHSALKGGEQLKIPQFDPV